jgi:hypothetical protein
MKIQQKFISEFSGEIKGSNTNSKLYMSSFENNLPNLDHLNDNNVYKVTMYYKVLQGGNTYINKIDLNNLYYSKNINLLNSMIPFINQGQIAVGIDFENYSDFTSLTLNNINNEYFYTIDSNDCTIDRVVTIICIFETLY